MPTISRAFRAHPGNYTPGGNRPRYIVVHYTANTASAEQEARYAANDQHPSSYPFVLDGAGTIYQLLDVTDTAWAVGGWAGTTQLIGNSESVSIEVCNDGGAFTTDEVAELRWLVRRLMGQLGIDADHVVRHFDCHTGRKDCPLYYAGFDSKPWAALHDTITREELIVTPQDVWNCPIAYQDPKSGKQMNKKAWELLSWGPHYDAAMVPKVNDIQTKVADLQNRMIAVEKAQAEQTSLIKNVQKALNAIVKKLA